MHKIHFLTKCTAHIIKTGDCRRTIITQQIKCNSKRVSITTSVSDLYLVTTLFLHNRSSVLRNLHKQTLAIPNSNTVNCSLSLFRMSEKNPFEWTVKSSIINASQYCKYFTMLMALQQRGNAMYSCSFLKKLTQVKKKKNLEAIHALSAWEDHSTVVH